MTLLTGLTAQGVEVPVRVDSLGRLVATASPMGVLPPGGDPGQILGKTGPEDFETDWVDDAGASAGLRSFGLRDPSLLSIPAGSTPTAILFASGTKLLNGATFDAATGRVTPTVAGSWWITGTVRLPVAATLARLRMRFNANDVGTNTRRLGSEDPPAILPVHYFGPFNGTTDFVSLEMTHNAASPLSVDALQLVGIYFPAP
jgi:hypothetical protein